MANRYRTKFRRQVAIFFLNTNILILILNIGFRTTKSHEGLIGRLRFSPCEQFLVTVGADGYVSIIDLESRKEELTLWAHSQPISDVVIHKDSVRFLTAGEDRYYPCYSWLQLEPYFISIVYCFLFGA